MDQKIIRDWEVRYYKNERAKFFVIKDRTEYEASREAEADPRILDSDDWTMQAKTPKSSRKEALTRARRKHKTSCFDCRCEPICLKDPEKQKWTCFNPI